MRRDPAGGDGIIEIHQDLAQVENHNFGGLMLTAKRRKSGENHRLLPNTVLIAETQRS